MVSRIQHLRHACLHALAALAMAFVIGQSALAAGATTAPSTTASLPAAAPTVPSITLSPITIRQATLFSPAGQRVVELPNILANNDFSPNGSLVR